MTEPDRHIEKLVAAVAKGQLSGEQLVHALRLLGYIDAAEDPLAPPLLAVIVPMPTKFMICTEQGVVSEVPR